MTTPPTPPILLPLALLTTPTPTPPTMRTSTTTLGVWQQMRPLHICPKKFKVKTLQFLGTKWQWGQEILQQPRLRSLKALDRHLCQWKWRMYLIDCTPQGSWPLCTGQHDKQSVLAIWYHCSYHEYPLIDAWVASYVHTCKQVSSWSHLHIHVYWNTIKQHVYVDTVICVVNLWFRHCYLYDMIILNHI